MPHWANAGPLHDAAKTGDVALIAQLLDQGANINESAGIGTPLHIAINTRHAEAAELLIQRGADVNARSILGMPLHAAAAKGMAPTAGLLLEHGADSNADWNTLKPLHIAAKYGHVDVAQILLDHGADADALTALDEPALHLAIINKHSKVSDLLRERGTKAPPAPAIEPLMASADPEHGSRVALPCLGCHSLDRAAKPNAGPPLWGIVGRAKASYVGFEYSEAMKASSGNWTYADLNNFIAHPAWTMPGVAMKMAGIHNAKDRADLIAYLRTLSDHPLPLP